MDYNKHQLWKKDDADNPFGVDIAVFKKDWCEHFLIEEEGVPYLKKTMSDGADAYHEFGNFNSWYVGVNENVIRVNHMAEELFGTGFGIKTGHLLPERFMEASR